MQFLSYSSHSDRALRKFNSIFSHDCQAHLFKRKMDLCSYQVHLIARDKITTDRLRQSSLSAETLLQLSKAWQETDWRASRPLSSDLNWKVIRKIAPTSSLSLAKNQHLRRFAGPHNSNNHLLLLSGDEAFGLPAYAILFLCNLWQLENGLLPIHAAGIKHQRGLYLFSGPSAAGKSTVSRLSCAAGDRVLDEDQLLVREPITGRYMASAWGYSLKTCKLPIRSFFKLVQSSEDRLKVLPQSKLALRIMQSSHEILGGELEGEALATIFKLSAALAHTIPGYELHFRKSPAFWKLIDKAIPFS